MRSLLTLSTLALLSLPAFAGGKEKAAVCTACHGVTGISANTLWPNLAGQKRDYLVKQLKAFHSGDRKDPLMTPMAAGLSEQDIADLADYFSRLSGK